MSTIPRPVSPPSRTYYGDSGTYPPTSPPTERESLISLVQPSNARHVQLPSINLVNALPNDLQNTQPSTSYPSAPIHGDRLKHSKLGPKSIEQPWPGDSQGRETMFRTPSPAPPAPVFSPNAKPVGPFVDSMGTPPVPRRRWRSPQYISQRGRVLANRPTSPSPTAALSTSSRMDDQPNGQSGSSQPNYALLRRLWGVISTWARAWPSGRRRKRVVQNQHAHIEASPVPGYSGLPPRSASNTPPLPSSKRHGPISLMSNNQSDPELENVSVAIVNESHQPVGTGSSARESALQSTSLGGMGAGLSIPMGIRNAKDRDERSIAQNDESVFDLRLLMRDQRPQNLTDTVEVDEEAYKRPKSGGNSLVYTGKWGEELVAVKIVGYRQIRTHDSEWKVDTERRFWREVEFAAAVSHPNINVFHGFANDEKFHMFGDFPAMISMWCRNGTILDYLNDEKPPVLQRIQLAHGVTKGVQYLHQLGLIHGDIKPTNILVDDEFVARICDLGSMRPIPGYGLDDMITAIPYLATERYMAKELFASFDNPHPIPTPEGDVYSLGCVIVEIVEHPVYAFGHVPAPGLRTAILKGELPASRSETNCGLPEELTESLWNLLEACWGPAAKRPRIKEVLRILTLVESACGG